MMLIPILPGERTTESPRLEKTFKMTRFNNQPDLMNTIGVEHFICQEKHTVPTKLCLHAFWSRHPTGALQATTSALGSSGRERRRAVRNLCPHPSSIPPAPFRSAPPLTSFPVQHGTTSVPFSKPHQQRGVPRPHWKAKWRFGFGH